jgi:hypothetical protein
MTFCNALMVVSKISAKVSSLRMAMRLVISDLLAVNNFVGRAKLSVASAPAEKSGGASFTAHGSLWGYW